MTSTTRSASSYSSTAWVFAVVSIVLLSVVLLGVAAYLLLSLGTVAVVVCAVVALVPLTIVLLTVRWIDQWEPEPRSALAFAFLWGAAGSVAIALLVDLGIQIAVYTSGVALDGAEAVGAVVQAPVVEESAKALGLLLLYRFARRTFDGPVDGIVYGAVIAAGFAFVENVQYFGYSFVESGPEDLAVTFVLRGVLSPFAHVMFTACTGAALGMAARSRSLALRPLWFFAGLACAMGLHALWNGASFLASNWLGFYLIVQIPLFAVAVTGVLLVRLAERRLTRERLEEYAEAGWFADDEVRMLSTGAGRRVARQWAREHGTATTRAMRAFIDASTRLAHARQRRLMGRADLAATQEEKQLLDAVTATRAALGAHVR